jgi:hypothetical protein
MGALEFISNIFGAVKEFFGFQRQKLEHKNTKEMKDAETAQKTQDSKDAINKAIKEKDEEAIRKALS